MDMIGMLSAWSPVVATVTLVSTGILAIIYAVGSLLSNEQMKKWASIEAVEVIYSIIIIAVALFIFALADSAAEGVIGAVHPGGPALCTALISHPDYHGLPCHLAVSKNFFHSIFDEGQDFSWGILRSYMWFSIFSSFGISNDFFEHTFGSASFSPFVGFFDVPLAVYGLMFDYSMKALMIAKFQEALVVFIGNSLSPVLFVVGAVLRAFPLSRKLGGLLMAIAVSLYYVYPIFFVMGSVVFDSIALRAPNGDVFGITYADLSSVQASPDYDLSTIYTEEQLESGEAFLDYSAQVGNVCQQERADAEGKIEQTSAWSNTLSKMDWEVFVPMSVDGMMGTMGGGVFGNYFRGGIIDGTSRLVFFTFFFSFIGIMATIASIKSLSPILGGDIEIAGLTHLV